MNLKAQVEFELTYFLTVVLFFKHYETMTLLLK